MPAAKTVTRPARTRPATTPKRTVRPKTRAEARPIAVAAVKAGPARSASKPPKLHRKPVRDSFTMPEADFALIATLKARALAGKRATKKSELLRAGLHALAALDAAGLMAALAGLAPVKVGRPKKAR